MAERTLMKTQNTRRAFLMSIVSLMLCFTMMLGTTLAWFTDTVVVENNRIVAGNLDVELWYANSATGGFANVDDMQSGDLIFVDANGEEILWEPGVVAYTNFQIKNVGNLALKYTLNAIVTSETMTLYKDEYYSLKDVIKVAIVDGGFNGDREEAIAMATELGKPVTQISAGELIPSRLLPDKDIAECAMILYWEPTANDNNYNLNNDRKGDAPLDIVFDIRLVATQLTEENDSFGKDYDEDSAWDGTIPATKPDTLVVDTANYLISINDPAAFAYLNTLINDPDFATNYGSKWKYSIELNTDVNLLNQPWTPITMSNFVSFDGNGHTISNLLVNVDGNNVGLFGVVSCNDIGVTYVKDLNIDGAYVIGNEAVGAVIGKSSQGVLTNVTVNDATVIGNKYVGGIFGHGNGSVNNSTVKNSTIHIPADGKKEAGGLIGYVSNDGIASAENKIIANNTVENVVVTAPTIAAGLVAQPNSSNSGGAVIEINNNTLVNVVVNTADDTSALYVSNNVNDKTLIDGNSFDNARLQDIDVYTGIADYSWFTAAPEATEFSLSTYEQLEALANLVDGSAVVPAGAEANVTLPVTFEGKTVKLESDVDLNKVDVNGERVSFDPIGYGYNIPFKGTFDGQGHTIKNLYQNGWALGLDYSTEGGGLFASVVDTTIKNLTIDGAEIVMECIDMGALVGYSYGNCTYENILVKNTTVANYNRYTGGVIGEVNGTQTFKNVDVDASTVVNTLWGSFDTSVGGIIGGKWGVADLTFEDCDVACRLDVYNDVTATPARQWYAYRRAGMLIGNSEESVSDNGRSVASASYLTAINCTVTYGDWVDYTYCEFNNMSTSWPHCRVQGGSSDPYYNARYGVAKDLNGNQVVDDNHVHADGEDHNMLLKFDQLFGGDVGVYGGASHPGVTVSYN